MTEPQPRLPTTTNGRPGRATVKQLQRSTAPVSALILALVKALVLAAFDLRRDDSFFVGSGFGSGSEREIEIKSD